MMAINSGSLWEGSLIGRLLTYILVLWDTSLIGRGMAAIAGFAWRIFAGSFFGRVLFANWPDDGAVDDSRTVRLLAGLNRLAARQGSRIGPFLLGAWESSLLGALGRRVFRAVAPVAGTSFLVQTLLGYPNDVVLAPAEDRRRTTSPVVYLLGLLLGFASLIPADSPLPSPTFIMVGGVWLLAGLWLVQKLMQGDFEWRASSAFLPLLLFLLVAAAAAVQSAARLDSLLNLVLWMTAFLVFWMAVNLVRTSRDVAALLGPILVAGALMGIWAAYQYFINPPVIEENWTDPESFENLVRAFAGFGNPNYLAEYMELFLPIGVALWLQQPKRRLAMGGLLGLMVLGLLLTSTRGAWLGVGLALGLFALMRFGRWNVLLGLGAVAGVLVVREVAPAQWAYFVQRLTSAFSLTNTSNAYRTSIWRGTLAMLEQHWPLGVGLGTVAFEKVYAGFAWGAAKAAHAHNVFLQLFAETGVIGIVAMLWALLAVVRRPFATGLSDRHPLVTAAVPAALIAILFHGLVEHVWYNPKLLFAFWAVAGMGMGLTLGDRKDTAL